MEFTQKPGVLSPRKLGVYSVTRRTHSSETRSLLRNPDLSVLGNLELTQKLGVISPRKLGVYLETRKLRANSETGVLSPRKLVVYSENPEFKVLRNLEFTCTQKPGVLTPRKLGVYSETRSSQSLKTWSFRYSVIQSYLCSPVVVNIFLH